MNRLLLENWKIITSVLFKMFRNLLGVILLNIQWERHKLRLLFEWRILIHR